MMCLVLALLSAPVVEIVAEKRVQIIKLKSLICSQEVLFRRGINSRDTKHIKT
jgi:hypothetical protein